MEQLKVVEQLNIEQEPAMYFKLLRKLLNDLSLDLGTGVAQQEFTLQELIAIVKKTYPEGDQIVLVTEFIAKWSDITVVECNITYSFTDRAQEALVFMEEDLR